MIREWGALDRHCLIGNVGRRRRDHLHDGNEVQRMGAAARQPREKKLLAEVGEAADELCVCHGAW